MNKVLGSIAFVQSGGMASRAVEESWDRLHTAKRFRVFSSCGKVTDFLAPRRACSRGVKPPSVCATVLDHSRCWPTRQPHMPAVRLPEKGGEVRAGEEKSARELCYE